MPLVIEISLDALYRETYDRIRVRSNYTRVLRNVLELITQRDRRALGNVKIAVSVVDHPLTRSEIPDFRRFWTDIADRVVIRVYNDWNGQLDEPTEYPRRDRVHGPCVIPFTRPAVAYDGKVVLLHFRLAPRATDR